jgi:hypothetical protein
MGDQMTPAQPTQPNAPAGVQTPAGAQPQQGAPIQQGAPNEAPIVPKPKSQAPQTNPGAGQPSLKNSGASNNIRMLPPIELKNSAQNQIAQQATNYPTNLVLPPEGTPTQTPAAAAANRPMRRVILGGVSRNPTAPAVANQLDQAATAPTSTMQR